MLSPFLLSCLTPFFRDKKIVVGITGSIAAYKAIELIRLLMKCGAQVRVILTPSARRFVTSLTLQALTKHAVYTSLWNTDAAMPHIDLARWADLTIVAPATANTVAQLANGLAPNLLLNHLLALTTPVWLAPSMNPTMWTHAATQHNVAVLRQRGVNIIEPVHGTSACGEEGVGNMADPSIILQSLTQSFCQPSREKAALITLGPTRSYLDPVRYMTNRSSGKMGMTLSWAAYALGYTVHVVQGPCEVVLPPQCVIEQVATSDEMEQAVLRRWPESHLFISTAAVLDWDMALQQAHKLKKTEGLPSISLKENADILAQVSKLKQSHQWVQGFAAETENLLANARYKLTSKSCDAIFANSVAMINQNVTSGFDSDDNQGIWLSHHQQVELGPLPKNELAYRIFDAIHTEWKSVPS